MLLPSKFKLRLADKTSGVEMYKSNTADWTWRDTDHQVFTGSMESARQLANANARSLYYDRLPENDWLFTTFKNPEFTISVVPVITEFWATKLDHSDLGYSFKMIEDLVTSPTSDAISWRSKNVHTSAQAAVDSISDFHLAHAKINKFEMIGSKLFNVGSCIEGNELLDARLKQFARLNQFKMKYTIFAFNANKEIVYPILDQMNTVKFVSEQEAKSCAGYCASEVEYKLKQFKVAINQYINVMVELGIADEIDTDIIAIGRTLGIMEERV